MKRVLGPCLAGLALLGAGIGLMSACQNNDSSMFVQNVLFPTPVAAGQSCVYTNDPTQDTLPSGKLDVALAPQYTAWYLVGNQLVSQSNSQDLKTETSIINVEGADVTVTDAAGNQLDYYQSDTSGTIYPSSGTTPGYGAFEITAASEKAVQAIVAESKDVLDGCGTTTLISYATFFGHTLGGTYITSNKFEFPITVCATTAGCGECLVGFNLSERGGLCVNPTTLVSAPYKLPNCLSPSSTAMSLPIPCVTGQDTPIDCSQCQTDTPCLGAYPDGPPACENTGGDD
jgi:hypothetical protein